MSGAEERYRPDIDGLRAIAVAAVVVFHAFPTSLPGGFVGVDVFFVISGYLISQLILQGIAGRRFSLAGFYARRIRRLLPALMVVLAAVFGFGWLLPMMPADYADLCRKIAAGALFISNFSYLSQVGYFDRAAEFKPLLHLWSLGVEEQFYLTWPLLLMFKPHRARAMAVAVASISLALAFWLQPHHPAAAFYLPFTRFWELMVGAILATGVGFRFNGPRLRVGGAAMGLLLVVISFAVFPPISPWLWLLLPTSGTALLIASGPGNGISKAMLSNRPIVGIGKISYPLYLWHWPLLSFLAISRQPQEATVSARLIAVAVAIVLAWLTYRLIETPIRFGRLRPLAVPALCVALVAIASVGFTGSARHGFPFRFPKPIRGYVTVKTDWWGGARVFACWLSAESSPDGFAAFCHPDTRPLPTIWVWGDSHAARLYVGIHKEFGGDIGELARDSCPPIVHLAYKICIESNDFALSLIEKTPPDTLIMFAVWNLYSNFDTAAAGELVATIRQVQRAGVRRIVVVGPAPQWTEPLPRVIYEQWHEEGTIPTRTSRHLVATAFSVDRRLKEIVGGTSAHYISLLDALCDPRGCLSRVEDGPQGMITTDYGHLTEEGAAYVARLLRDDILPKPASDAGHP